ncbi:hypothetical protein Tcan_05377 [Toxocara canis]|uniref:Uncharacterized protein n=1 Tax=Toxocara canis TaxID=6265 RepID=A0A0B2VQI1_TOXCA|nr:hypothetical protein Tcan_05377 [Toxocara canis]
MGKKMRSSAGNDERGSGGGEIKESANLGALRHSKRGIHCAKRATNWNPAAIVESGRLDDASKLSTSGRSIIDGVSYDGNELCADIPGGESLNEHDFHPFVTKSRKKVLANAMDTRSVVMSFVEKDDNVRLNGFHVAHGRKVDSLQSNADSDASNGVHSNSSTERNVGGFCVFSA